MKLSIIIPTRSRGNYLRSSILSAIFAANNTDWPVEIIVSDNASEDDTENIVKSFSDKRIIYLKTQKRLSMRANFEFALGHSSGSHLLFIGDDDAVVPHGLRLLTKIIEQTDTDAVKWRIINYVWPNLETGRPGHVKLRTRQLSAVRATIDSQKLLQQFCRGGIRSYMKGAMIYHGCVSRRIIDRVRNIQDGPYFRCAAPDVYAAIQNVFVVKTPIQAIDIPITIGGESPKSNGASALRYGRGLDEGDNKVFELFAKEYRDDKYIGVLRPDNPSVTMHMLDSLQTASKVLNVPIDVSSKNWAKIIMNEIRLFSPEIQRKCREQARDLLGEDFPQNKRLPNKQIAPSFKKCDASASFEYEKLSIRNGFFKIQISGGNEMKNSATAAKFIDELLSVRDYSISLSKENKPAIWRILDIHLNTLKYRAKLEALGLQSDKQ
ncbi:MAG: glycosyltransferase family 2 protein [Albidovulum sp.]|nr:glycosyltransferase family 2 protein [Albidovulum sp.]